MDTTIKVEVALPLTTAEVEEVFKKPDGSLNWEQIEGCTTSQTCEDCGERIWMQNYGLAIKPTEFPCPYCYKRQQHLFAGVPALNSSAFSSPIYGALRKKATAAFVAPLEERLRTPPSRVAPALPKAARLDSLSD